MPRETSTDPLAIALFIIAAFTIAGLMHSAWLRSSRSRPLAIPIDGGMRVRGRRLFGENKTVRGFVVMVPAAALAFSLLGVLLGVLSSRARSSIWPLTDGELAMVGLCAGLGFMLGELPNSFAKRQLDVPPGQAPRGRLAMLVSFIVDRIDSIIGMLAAISFATPTPWMTWVYVLALGPAVHWSFSLLLFRLGVKARPA